MDRCGAITKGGERCKGIPIGTSGLCSAHHPDHMEARRRASRRGGRAGGRGRPSKATAELVRLQGVFEQLGDDVLAGTTERGAAAVAIQALNGARSCVVASLKARETEEFEERLAALEAEQQGGSSIGSSGGARGR